MNIKIINKSEHPLPQYETAYAAGMDLRASIAEDIILKPLQRQLISTGLYIELPVGYEVQIRPRSGWHINMESALSIHLEQLMPIIVVS